MWETNSNLHHPQVRCRRLQPVHPLAHLIHFASGVKGFWNTRFNHVLSHHTSAEPRSLSHSGTHSALTPRYSRMRWSEGNQGRPARQLGGSCPRSFNTLFWDDTVPASSYPAWLQLVCRCSFKIKSRQYNLHLAPCPPFLGI